MCIRDRHDTIDAMAINGHIVFGEGDEFESPKLFDGQKLGAGGKDFDIALDAIEGTTLAAKAMHDALSVLAITPKGGLFHAPNLYMEKIAIGANYPKNIVAVSYTHLDVYKRQSLGFDIFFRCSKHFCRNFGKVGAKANWVYAFMALSLIHI